MASLTDLFNPTFLMFLGILVLVVALLVVYFETKFREQNHKISSMLSLVSSLAEELNGTKMVVQHLTMRPVSNSQNFQQQQQQQQQPNLEEKFVTKYIKLDKYEKYDILLLDGTNYTVDVTKYISQHIFYITYYNLL